MRIISTAFRAATIGLGACLFQPAPAGAHSWYPRDCCSDRDCKPADDIITDARGDMTVVVGPQRIWVPRGFAIRPSEDHRIHVCYHVDDFKFLMPLCLFVPGYS